MRFQLLVILLIASPAAAWTENFDSFFPNQFPESPNYTYNSPSGCGKVTDAQSSSVPNSLQFSTGTTSGCAAFIIGPVCNSGLTVSLKFKMTSSFNGNFRIMNALSSNGGANSAGGFMYNINVGGNPGIVAENDDGTTNSGGTMGGAVLAANTWYTATFSGFYCNTENPTCSPGGNLIPNCPTVNPPVCYVDLTYCDNVNYYATFSIAGIGTVATKAPHVHQLVNRQALKQLSAFGTAGSIYVDDLSVSDPPPAVTSTSVSVTALAGYAMDPFAGFIIARHTNAPYSVKTYDAQSLQLLSSAANACNRTDGVLAYQKPSGSMYAAYLECYPETGSLCTDIGLATPCTLTEKLKIRSHQLSDPDITGTQCTVNNFCSDAGDYFLQRDRDQGNTPLSNCNNLNRDNFPMQAGQLGNIQAMPISYERGQDNDGSLAPHKVAVGFAYVNANPSAQGGGGNLGVFVDLLRNKEDDKSCGLEVPFTTPNSASSMCSWRDAESKNDYIAAGAASAGKVWKSDVDPQFGAVLHEPPQVDINVVHALPAPYNALATVACSQNTDIIVMTTTGDIYRLGVTGPTVDKRWGPIKAGAGISRGLAFSGDGKWFAYAKGASVIVGDATTGATATTITMPSGNFVGISLDDVGNLLYTVTTTTILRSVVYPATTKAPVAEGTRCTGTSCHLVAPDGTTITPGGGGSGAGGQGGINPGDFLKPAIDGMKTLFGGAGPWILGIILIVALGAFGLYKWGKGIGVTLALLGLAISIAVGFIDLWFLAVFILLCAAAFVMKQRMWSLS